MPPSAVRGQQAERPVDWPRPQPGPTEPHLSSRGHPGFQPPRWPRSPHALKLYYSDRKLPVTQRTKTHFGKRRYHSRPQMTSMNRFKVVSGTQR